MDFIVSKLFEIVKKLEETPSGGPFPISDWDFFKDDLEDWVICYLHNKALNRRILINSFIMPQSVSIKAFEDSLLSAEYSSAEGWILYNDGKIDTPLSTRQAPLNQAEPLYFLRTFQGHPRGEEHYFEMDQKFTNILGLHWVKAKDAFCTLNSRGDLESQIILNSKNDLTYILIKRNILDKFLSISKADLIRCFEYRQFDYNILEKLPVTETTKSTLDPNFCYKNELHKFDSVTEGIFIRGYQIVNKKKDFAQLEKEEREADNGKPPLEFIIKDFRHGGATKTVALQKENFATYFDPTSVNPYETSPVFFRPEVLNKYRNDPEKYNISQREISCRGGWHLQTYDINDQGQVHTMAIYLINLPYAELCYWLSFNEAPRGDISQRSFDTDFLGKFSGEPDPINELKKALRNLWETKIQPENESLWRPDKDDFDKTFFGFYYVISENYDQWQSFIQDLSRIVIEGLTKQTINKIAIRLKCHVNDLGSIQLLKKCLQTVGIGKERIDEAISSLTDLYKTRSSKTRAHRRGELETDKLKQDAMDRLKKVTDSINCLAAICSEGKLDDQAD
ncbi:MAG: hypothetical protein AB7I18_05905 [Candidatus Berkiella sp.]